MRLILKWCQRSLYIGSMSNMKHSTLEKALSQVGYTARSITCDIVSIADDVNINLKNICVHLLVWSYA